MPRAYDPPGSMSRDAVVAPIAQIPSVPGGTLTNVVLPGASRVFTTPDVVGTNATLSRRTLLGIAANASRGSGHAGTRAPEALVYAGSRRAGVRSNHGLLGAIVRADIRNPYVARHLLRSKMTAGATRYS